MKEYNTLFLEKKIIKLLKDIEIVKILNVNSDVEISEILVYTDGILCFLYDQWFEYDELSTHIQLKVYKQILSGNYETL